MDEIVISCFDYSGVFVRPWAAAGYDCICVDILHGKDKTVGNITYVGADVLDWDYYGKKRVKFAAFFVPCTHTAITGARWFRDKGLVKLEETIKLWRRSFYLAEKWGCPYFIENPKSVINSYEPASYSFSPEDYGDVYTKKTYLWTGGGFIMPEKKKYKGVLIHDHIHKGGHTQLRDRTPEGFSRAVFEANKNV